MAWANLPTAWAKPKGKAKNATEALVYPMAEISWRDHRSAGIAAFLVIMTLAVRLNESCKLLPPGAVRPTKVAVTWDELRTITGCARATLGKAILLLESWGAIKTTKLGRANHYELVDVSVPGSYCRLPQTFLEADGDPVARFKNLPTNLIGLNALKLYILLLILRSTETNTSSISYSGIVKWTGIRRQDIRKAWGFLDGQQLATVSLQRDARHNQLGANDQSQRYAVFGLTPGFTKRDAKEAIADADLLKNNAAAASSNNFEDFV